MVQKSVDGHAILPDSAEQTNAISESAGYKELITKIELQQVELDTAYKTIAKLHSDAESQETKIRTTASALAFNQVPVTAPSLSIPSPSIQDIKASQAYGELLKTKEEQALQLDKALQTIVRLREDATIERKKAAQALNERYAIQEDLEKFRAMQRESYAKRPLPQSPVKPWYKFW